MGGRLVRAAPSTSARRTRRCRWRRSRRSPCTRSRCWPTGTSAEPRRHHDPVRRARTSGSGSDGHRRRLDADRCSACPTTPAGASAPRAGAGCTASRRWPGCSASARAGRGHRRRARHGSSSPVAAAALPAARCCGAGSRHARAGGAAHERRGRRALRLLRRDLRGARRRRRRPGGGRGGAHARRLLDWHDRFTRFDAGSELARLNADPREHVPVSGRWRRSPPRSSRRAERTGGLVDGTLLRRARGRWLPRRPGQPAAAPARAAAGAARAGRRAGRRGAWRRDRVDGRRVRRPPGRGLDSGGLVKGLFADLLARAAGGAPSFAVDCAGDLRLGGSRTARARCRSRARSATTVLHTFEPAAGGVATSGIGRRSWIDAARAPRAPPARPRRPAGPRSPASCRRPRWRRRRSRPRCSRRPRC